MKEVQDHNNLTGPETKDSIIYKCTLKDSTLSETADFVVWFFFFDISLIYYVVLVSEV